MNKKVLIIIPVYNEENNIEKVLNEIDRVIPNFEIIVVNDGSQDNTLKVLEKRGVSVLTHPINLGYGAAVQTGLKYAVEKGYDIGILFDGDGQHDPNDVMSLLNALEKNSVDVVVGSRFIGRARYKTQLVKKIGMVMFSFLTYLITRHKIYDITSGFQALNRKALEFLSLEYPIDFPDAEVIIMLSLSGFKTIEVPVTIRQRLSGHSMYSALRSIYYPFRVLVGIIAIVLRSIFVNLKRRG